MRWSNAWFFCRYNWNFYIALRFNSYNSSLRRLAGVVCLVPDNYFCFFGVCCCCISIYSSLIIYLAAFYSTIFMKWYILSYYSLNGNISSSSYYSFIYCFLALFIYSSFFILKSSFLYFYTLYFSTYFLAKHYLQKNDYYGIYYKGGSRQ